VVGAAEQTFGELTGALADLTAKRNQLTQTAREQSERVAGSKAKSPISKPALPPSRRAGPMSSRLQQRSKVRKPQSPRPNGPRSPLKPPTARRARTWTPPAFRWPTPNARCSASTPKPRR
jgi:hypothetical protein